MTTGASEGVSRTPRFSETEMTELVLPQHANAIGTAFGGTVMGWIDICAAIASQRHCGAVAVTAAIDDLHFVSPIRVGDVVRLKARLNAAFRTSVEVEVKVEVEETSTLRRRPCVDALLTFVLVGPDGKAQQVPPLVLETDDDRARYEAATIRRKNRGHSTHQKN